jgi:hypothetical protein
MAVLTKKLPPLDHGILAKVPIGSDPFPITKLTKP